MSTQLALSSPGPAIANPRRSSFLFTKAHSALFHGNVHHLRLCERRLRRASYSTKITAAASPPTTAQTTDLPSGSPQNTTFNWKDHWYPIVYDRDVAPGDLYKFTLLETPLVIWRDPKANNAPRAFRDACPHRLVPLSEGRISNTGCLECPYHGWQFNGSDGKCTAIPQGGGTDNNDPCDNPRSRAIAFQCISKQGLIWVKLKGIDENSGISAEEEASIPILPELEDTKNWFELSPMWRDLPMDYTSLISNVVDVGHVPFTHHASVSKRQSSGVFDDMQVTEKTETGFKGIWPTGPRRGALGAQHTLFQGPQLMRHTIDAFDTRGFANITAVYGVPIAPGKCRLIVRQPFKFKNKVIRTLFGIMPEFRGHLGNLSVLDDDNIFLHEVERENVERGIGEKPLGQVFYLPGPSDSYVATFHQWLDRVAGGGPFGPQNKEWLQRAGPRLSKPELLEHYHSHVEKCKICSTALKRIQLLKGITRIVTVAGGVVAVAAGIAAIAAVRLSGTMSLIAAWSAVAPFGISGAVITLIGGVIWAWCNKTLPMFYKGTHPPLRNKVAGEWSPMI